MLAEASAPARRDRGRRLPPQRLRADPEARSAAPRTAETRVRAHAYGKARSLRFNVGPRPTGYACRRVGTYQVKALHFLSFACVAACGGTTLAPQVPDKPRESMLTEQANLLLFPHGDPEGLLGRAVQATSDGAWTIADARAPGCEVSVRRTKAEYSAHRQVDIHNMTSISAGFAKFVNFEAKFGRANKADIDVTNTEILRADTRGPCGDTIVDTVFVGHGKRELLASAEAGGSASAQIGVMSPSATTEASASVVDSTAWESNQAYGFTYKRVGQTPQLDLRVKIPRVVTDGDSVQIQFETTRPAYLIVYYLEADGRGDVLWPSQEEPEPTAAPGAVAVLPSASERNAGIDLKAALGATGSKARETLVTYAFTEKADFDRLSPGANGSSDDGATYAAALTARLADVPMSRWTRAMVSYVIQPKPAARTNDGSSSIAPPPRATPSTTRSKPKTSQGR